LKADRLGLLNRLVALAALIVIMPVMIVLALAIVIDSGFPLFFSQERLGLHGQRFRMLKFRKFHSTIGRNTRPLTLTNDSRCTRVGKFLAKTKLDELPQLWNVVRGDMAVVGPRPEVIDFEECFEGPFRKVLDYRPGIFGPSQAAFRAESAFYPPDQNPQDFYRAVLFPAKAALDLAYFPNRTVLGDIKWVLLCIRAVCRTEFELPCGVAEKARTPGRAGAAAGNNATSQ
jgi:lipopolysaccharide/colanic/teichoic acid biosynthesis glycosyltransferase